MGSLLEFAKQQGVGRQEIHAKNTTERFYEDPTQENTTGALGEAAFSRVTGLPMNTEFKAEGDGGIDFVFHLRGRRITIDVKSALKPKYLLLKEGTRKAADIFVLCGVSGRSSVFLGWEHKSIMLLMPVRDFGKGIRSHYRRPNALRPMWQLYELIKEGSPEPKS